MEGGSRTRKQVAIRIGWGTAQGLYTSRVRDRWCLEMTGSRCVCADVNPNFLDVKTSARCLTRSPKPKPVFPFPAPVMPRPTWTTDAEATWLSERKKAFADAQADGTTRAFLNATTESFLGSFPRQPPTPAELAEHNGNEEEAQKAQKKQIRGVSTVSLLCSAVLLTSDSEDRMVVPEPRPSQRNRPRHRQHRRPQPDASSRAASPPLSGLHASVQRPCDGPHQTQLRRVQARPARG